MKGMADVGTNSNSQETLCLWRGLIGTLKNADKVIGPKLARSLIHWLDYARTFRFLGLMLVFEVVLVWSWLRIIPRTNRERLADSMTWLLG